MMMRRKLVEDTDLEAGLRCKAGKMRTKKQLMKLWREMAGRFRIGLPSFMRHTSAEGREDMEKWVAAHPDACLRSYKRRGSNLPASSYTSKGVGMRAGPKRKGATPGPKRKGV